LLRMPAIVACSVHMDRCLARRSKRRENQAIIGNDQCV
jgi:hypothetical protein